MMVVETEITVAMQKPHTTQLEVKHHPAKRKVVNAGRRWGKTMLAAQMSVERMLKGQRALTASTTQEQSDVFWDLDKRWLGDAIEMDLIEKNEQRRTLTMPSSGGRIRVKTGRDPDVLRGDYCDFLVLDECALLDPDAWFLVGAPMLLDTDGDALFLSTPKGQNWFQDIYERGLDGSNGWMSWQFTSYDNPHLSSEALERLKDEIPASSQDQELLAQFRDLEGETHALIPASLVDRAIGNGQVNDDGDLTFGVDVARYGDDKTVVAARSGGRIHWLREWAKASTTETEKNIANLMLLYHPPHVVIDEVGVGAGVYDGLVARQDWGDDYEPQFTGYNAGTKAFDTVRYANRRAEDYVALAKRFEDGEIAIPDDRELRAQLSSIRYTHNTKRQIQIESKEQMRKRKLRSPDKADALVLSFQAYEGIGIWFPDD